MNTGGAISRIMFLIAALACLPAAALVTTSDFMPKGGKTLLMELLASKAKDGLMAPLQSKTQSAKQWKELLTSLGVKLNGKEVDTLASYLSLNMPVDFSTGSDIAAVLPPDGRQLAWEGCQSCHSLFSGYLTQDRDVNAWQNLFASPFHKELSMKPRERDEFVHYSAINMPMKTVDVPEDLRF